MRRRTSYRAPSVDDNQRCCMRKRKALQQWQLPEALPDVHAQTVARLARVPIRSVACQTQSASTPHAWQSLQGSPVCSGTSMHMLPGCSLSVLISMMPWPV